MREIINFVSMHDGLLDIEETKPKPAINFIPEWFTSLPLKDPETGARTPKRCPGIFDYFEQGYILPAWCDMRFSYDKEADYWSSTLGASDDFSLEIHSNPQFLDHVPAANVNGVKPTFIFKLTSPWFVITKPGWSVLQLPLFYHFNNDFSTLPGVIDTDIYHQINQQILYFGDKEDIVIKRGQPLVQYIPFKRQKIKFKAEKRNKNNYDKIYKANSWMSGKFANSSAYRQLQKKRDFSDKNK